jgi:hypothetical protein
MDNMRKVKMILLKLGLNLWIATVSRNGKD